MMRMTACLCAFTLVKISLGEHSLRGQPRPQGSLVLDKPTSQKSLMSMTDSVTDADKKPRGQVDQLMTGTDHKEWALMNSFEILAFFLAWLALYVPLAAFYYAKVRYHVEDFSEEAKQHKVDKHSDDGERHLRQFSSGLFGCRKQLGITFWSFCCPGIRWSDTMDKLGIHRFWIGFWIMTALYCISFIPKATVICQLMVVMYMTYHRQELRHAFEFEDQGGATWITDCCTYMCCMGCAVAQEARHTRLACVTDHKAIQIWPESARPQ
jgi:Cys-rich protein (TIGR01571 family)